jgi:hypothetical protein
MAAPRAGKAAGAPRRVGAGAVPRHGKAAPGRGATATLGPRRASAPGPGGRGCVGRERGRAGPSQTGAMAGVSVREPHQGEEGHVEGDSGWGRTHRTPHRSRTTGKGGGRVGASRKEGLPSRGRNATRGKGRRVGKEGGKEGGRRGERGSPWEGRRQCRRTTSRGGEGILEKRRERERMCVWGRGGEQGGGFWGGADRWGPPPDSGGGVTGMRAARRERGWAAEPERAGARWAAPGGPRGGGGAGPRGVGPRGAGQAAPGGAGWAARPDGPQGEGKGFSLFNFFLFSLLPTT